MPPIFSECPWHSKRGTVVFCYECHEELIHNPVFLPCDLEVFAELVRLRGLDEQEKAVSRTKLAGRIKLLHEVITTGLRALREEAQKA